MARGIPYGGVCFCRIRVVEYVYGLWNTCRRTRTGPPRRHTGIATCAVRDLIGSGNADLNGAILPDAGPEWCHSPRCDADLNGAILPDATAAAAGTTHGSEYSGCGHLPGCRRRPELVDVVT